MMLHCRTKCESKCSFCALSLTKQGRGYMCNGGDFTPKKRLRLETNRDTHQALHEALSSKDCGTVCHLLDAGEKLCSTDGIENCFILITKFYNSECLERELTSQPSAIHCRGPQGQTLLMYANQIYTLQTLFKFEPDVNACNDIGENVLIHLIRENTRNYSSSNYMFHRMAEFILYKGIDATTTDQLGKTAIEYVLEFYIRMNSSDPPFPTDDIFKKLLTAGATMPGADSFGRTPAMYFARDSACTTYTFRFILYLLQQGVDPKARDCNRHNLMYFVIRSYFTAGAIVDLSFNDQWVLYAKEISLKCMELLLCGCELGGLDEIFDRKRPFSFKVGNYPLVRKVAKSVNILSLLLCYQPFSDFIKELPRHNLTLKKSTECISELTFYFLDYNKWPIDNVTFEMVEATVTHLLASGVNVMQHTDGSRYLLGRDADELEKEILLTFPDSLWLAGQIMLRVADLIEYKTVKMKPYTVSCKILLSLLRFWNYPPLTLFIFLYAYDHKNSSFCVLTMLKFLTRVGGRLPPGSPLFKCLMKDLENDPSFDKYIRKQPQFFSKLREEIPSLKELCRPAVRATLSKITTSGLDLSSLRVLCQGELREIPREIQDYLNFKDQPEFCEEDLANK